MGVEFNFATKSVFINFSFSGFSIAHIMQICYTDSDIRLISYGTGYQRKV